MKKVTTRDIAAKAGVSQSTVSLVLSEKAGVSLSDQTRRRVREAAESLGYAPPRRPRRTARTDVTVALLAPTLTNLYYPFLIQNIQLYASERGVRTILLNTLRDREADGRPLAALAERGCVDGALCLYAPRFPLPAGLPAVVVSEKNPQIPYDTVSLNSKNAGYMMADHLLSLGHARIAYISSPFGNITNSRRNRLEGVSARMARQGLEKYLSVWVDEDETELLDTAYEFNVGRAMTRKLMEARTDATAIIAVNDMTAAGCMSVLNERGVSIPGQMAVCGFDNLLISRIMHPQLTSIDQMSYHGGKTALDILLEKIHSPRDDADLTIRLEYEPHLFVRGSTVADAARAQ